MERHRPPLKRKNVRPSWSLMFCPECGSEYVAGVAECAGCGVALVDRPAPGRPVPPTLDPVVVFTSAAAEPIAIAKSILISAGIGFSVCGEEIQDIFGYGRFPMGRNNFIGPMQVLVAPRDADDARALLAGLDADEPLVYGGAEEDDIPIQANTFWTTARRNARTVVLVMLVGEAILVALIVALGFLFNE